MSHAKNIIDRFDVTTLLQPGVPLSARTMKRRTGMKHRAIMAAIYAAVKNGTVRRVNANEVGSGKYNEADQRPDPRAPTSHLDDDDDARANKKTKRKKTYQTRKFNVFVLV